MAALSPPPTSQPQTQSQTQNEQANGSPAAAASASALPSNNPILPATSATDSGTGPRPRDARTIHLILSQMGVSAYQERVPLQLLDFAYRYTAAILSDAQHLAAEGYNQTSGSGSGGGKGSSNEDISLNAVRMAAAARQVNQFTGGKESKEQLLERATETNKTRLPPVAQQGPKFGIRLPHERFLLTGRSWDLNAQWELEDADDEDEDGPDSTLRQPALANGEQDDEEMGEDDAAEGGDDGFEQVFGEDQEEEEDSKMEEG